MMRQLYGALFLLGLVVLCSAASDADRMFRTFVQRYGNDAAPGFRGWREMIAGSGELAEAEKLRRVNDYFNRRQRFVEDTVVWNQADYWATPIEFIGKGAGDCEDFSIAKYFSLIELGVSRDKLRLIYVRARIGAIQSNVSVAHMVLGYYRDAGSEPLVLDNLIGDIRTASQRPDLAPVFSFNGDGVWMAGAERPTSPVDRLSRWNDLITRMKAEGYEP